MLPNKKYTISYIGFRFRTDEPIQRGVRVEMAHSEEYARQRVVEVVKSWSLNVARVETQVISVE